MAGLSCTLLNHTPGKETMNGLFLDDDRNPEDVTWLTYPSAVEWTVVRTFETFTQAMLEATLGFDLISFDHDLMDFKASGEEMTGYTCFKWVEDRCLDGLMALPECVVHSKNGVGGENIARHYDNLRRHLHGA